MSGAMKEVLLEPADHRLGVMRKRGDVVHLCYLWALAGESMTLAPSYDPVHAWLA